MIVASTQRARANIYVYIYVYMYIYIYVSPRDVELSSCSMMDVYHVRQRPRHLLHHHHLLSRFFFFLSTLSRCRPPSASRYRNNFSKEDLSHLAKHEFPTRGSSKSRGERKCLAYRGAESSERSNQFSLAQYNRHVRES